MNGIVAQTAEQTFPIPGAPDRAKRWSLFAVGSVVVGAFVVALSTGQGAINWDGLSLCARFLRAAANPAWNLEILQLTATSMLTTLAFALCGGALSVILGSIGGVLASDTWWELWRVRSGAQERRAPVHARAVRALLTVPRGIHELVWGLLLINVLGLDPIVAVLAIALPFGAITAKVFAETIDEVPRFTATSYRMAGATTMGAFAYGVLPRAFPLLLSYALYRLECAIRSAAVLGLIGAGGLGYQILLSLQSLRYEEVWTFLYALMALVALTDWGNSRVTLALRQRSAANVTELTQQTRTALVAAGVVVVAVMCSAWYLHMDLGRLFEPARLTLLADVLADTFPPRLAAGDVTTLLQLSAETVVMSIVAIVMAGVPAIVISLFATTALLNTSDRGATSIQSSPVVRVIAGALRTLLIGIRGLSDGIWVLLATLVFFPGVFAGACALAIYNFGVIGRILTQVNESSDKRAFTVLRTQGASFGGAVFYGLLPQTFNKYLAYILYRWEVCLRATVVVGVAGAGGLGAHLEQQMASFDYRGVATTLICFIVLTIVVDFLSTSGRRMLRAA